jgi:hypothetical protein
MWRNTRHVSLANPNPTLLEKNQPMARTHIPQNQRHTHTHPQASRRWWSCRRSRSSTWTWSPSASRSSTPTTSGCVRCLALRRRPHDGGDDDVAWSAFIHVHGSIHHAFGGPAGLTQISQPTNKPPRPFPPAPPTHITNQHTPPFAQPPQPPPTITHTVTHTLTNPTIISITQPHHRHHRQVSLRALHARLAEEKLSVDVVTHERVVERVKILQVGQ